MKTQNLNTKACRLMAAAMGVLLCTLALPVIAQTTAFTYQGRLNDGANPASGIYDLRFALYDAATAGNAQGNALTNTATVVSNGLFTVTLDFGNQFPGADRWLEIGVRTNGGGAFSLLTPRQPLTATPYAVRAAYAATAASVSGSVAASQLTGTISSNNIGAGSISSGMLANGAVTTEVLANGAVTSAKVATVSNWFALTIANPTPASFDQFGNAVAALGSDRVLIGANGDDTGAPGAGAAYLFSTNGTLLTTFNNPIPEGGGSFGSPVAAVGSDRVLIGAPGDDTGADNAGAAYLFSTNGTRLVTFTNPTPANFDSFGVSVAAVGSGRVLIGALRDDTGAMDAGAAYLFSTSGTLLTTFTTPAPAAEGDQFGSSVAAVGSDRVVIGAPMDDTGAQAAGAAYLFSTNGIRLVTFANPTPAILDNFGVSVAAVGSDRVLIGANSDNTGANDAGAAYLFSTNGTLLTTFTNPTPAILDNFGVSVAAVGSDRVLIGANGDDTGVPGAGAAYLFSTNGTLLATIKNPTPEDSDSFGNAVAAVGSDRLLIGALSDNTGAESAGAAYLFNIETFTDGLVADAVRARSVTTASLEDGAVTAAKIGGVLLISQIPELDASKITSGTLDDARLSTKVALLNRSPQTFTGINHFTQRVGIGTTSPVADLHVNGPLVIQGPAVVPGSTSSSNLLNLMVGGGSSAVATNGSLNGISFYEGAGAMAMSLGYDGSGSSSLNALRIYHSSGSPLFTFEASGQIGIGTTSPSERLHVVGNILATGTITPSSDRNRKKNFAAVDPLAVLAKVSALPIQQWTYQAEADAVHHLGPMAQDFHAAFGLGANDVTIATVDADGVALAAIQGLNQKLTEELTRRDAENAELKARLETLEQLLNRRLNGGAK